VLPLLHHIGICCGTKRRVASDAWHLAETNNMLLLANVWVRLAVLGMAGVGEGDGQRFLNQPQTQKSGGDNCHSYSAVGLPGI
jgi:hypothetical protein